MLDIQTRIKSLKRPPLLARAARFGVDDYRREIHLKRILKLDETPRSADAVMRLLDIELDMNKSRMEKRGDYSPAKHVDVLIAILGEARLLKTAYLS